MLVRIYYRYSELAPYYKVYLIKAYIVHAPKYCCLFPDQWAEALKKELHERFQSEITLSLKVIFEEGIDWRVEEYKYFFFCGQYVKPPSGFCTSAFRTLGYKGNCRCANSLQWSMIIKIRIACAYWTPIYEWDKIFTLY